MSTGRQLFATIEEPVEGVGTLRLVVHPPDSNHDRSAVLQLIPPDPLPGREGPRLVLPVDALMSTRYALRLASWGVRAMKHYRLSDLSYYGGTLTVEARPSRSRGDGSFSVALGPRAVGPAELFPLAALNPAIKALDAALAVESPHPPCTCVGEDL